MAVLLALPVIAQQAGSEDAAGDQYRIELVVFRHLDQSRTTIESLELSADMRSRQDSTLTTTDLSRPALEQPVDAERFTAGYRAVPVANARLQAARDRLARLSAYEIIGHVAWLQPATGRQPPNVRLSDVGLNSSRAVGRVSLSDRRTLDLAVNLSLTDGLPMPISGDASGPRVSSLAESRRILLGQLHYFDHPQFGVLAIVTRAP